MRTYGELGGALALQTARLPLHSRIPDAAAALPQ
jgi:hypothetical protein